MPWQPVALTCSLSLTDINECVTERHTCQRREHCVNTMGSFRCLQELSCQPGHELKDGECVGKERLIQPLHRGKGRDCKAFWCCCSVVPAAKEAARVLGFAGSSCTFTRLKWFPGITVNCLEQG